MVSCPAIQALKIASSTRTAYSLGLSPVKIKMTAAVPRINPELDIPALAEEFQKGGKIRIQGVLTEEFANDIFACLENDVPWRLMYYNHQGKGPEVVGRVYPQQWDVMSEQQKQDLVDRINEEAKDKFQYFYNAYDVLAARRKALDPQLFLQKFLDFMGSDELFGFIQQVSNDRVFNRVDCHACRYLPGHFLKEHVDSSPHENRHMAYVFNFTRNWDADFGGLTHFLDDQHKVTETFTPDFNTLTLFKVPVPHSVSVVSPFAPNPRYSITGWFTRYN